MSSVGDWRLAVDIGGTFTDVGLLDGTSGSVHVEKTLTTPSAPLDAVRLGITCLLDRAGVRPDDIVAPIVHATTLITNALIEGKTGRAALVTTSGFSSPDFGVALVSGDFSDACFYFRVPEGELKQIMVLSLYSTDLMT